MADIYDIQDQLETWQYFEETEVEEYPAVFNYFSDDPQYGNCNVTVGISDQLVYTVYVQGQSNIDVETGCDLVAEVATAVLHVLNESQ